MAVVGSRDFSDYGMAEKAIGKLVQKNNITELISGGAGGADLLAERYAREHAIPITVHKPDWAGHKRGAGHRRNEIIVNSADLVLAFWDGKSRGTKDTLDLACKLGKDVRIEVFER